MTEPTSDTNEPQQTPEDRTECYRRVGDQLRLRREALELEQSDVARDLHLPGIVVNDLETGRIDHLSSLYRRGYIRNYADLLGLDADRLLAEAGEEQPPELKRVLPAARRGFQVERYLKFATYAIVTVAIVPPLVYFFLAGGSRMLDSNGAAVDERSLTTTPAEEARPVEFGASSRTASDANEAPHVSASTLPLNPMRPVSERAAESSERSDSTAGVPEPGESLEPTVNLTALGLELLDDSWVEITDAEGERLEYDLLRAGQRRQYEGQAPFTLLVGRSSAVRLVVNGQVVSWEGDDSGDVAELSVSGDGEILR
jgi:cytoskeleton protein RodZ